MCHKISRFEPVPFIFLRSIGFTHNETICYIYNIVVMIDDSRMIMTFQSQL